MCTPRVEPTVSAPVNHNNHQSVVALRWPLAQARLSQKFIRNLRSDFENTFGESCGGGPQEEKTFEESYGYNIVPGLLQYRCTGKAVNKCT